MAAANPLVLAQEKHSSLWYDDGNIILISFTADKSRHVLFRIHKSILAEQSAVFAGMFSLPDSMDNYVYGVEGVPSVSMTDDAEDIEILLSILYHPMWVVACLQRVSVFADRL